MVIEQNTLSLNIEDCELIESRLKEGLHINEIILEEIKPLYPGNLDDLEGVEIPADYWFFVNEFGKELSLK